MQSEIRLIQIDLWICFSSTPSTKIYDVRRTFYLHWKMNEQLVYWIYRLCNRLNFCYVSVFIEKKKKKKKMINGLCFHVHLLRNNCVCAFHTYCIRFIFLRSLTDFNIFTEYVEDVKCIYFKLEIILRKMEKENSHTFVWSLNRRMSVDNNLKIINNYVSRWKWSKPHPC